VIFIVFIALPLHRYFSAPKHPNKNITNKHPFGNVKPSGEDQEITERLQQAVEVLWLRLLDHIVFSAALVRGSLKPRRESITSSYASRATYRLLISFIPAVRKAEIGYCELASRGPSWYDIHMVDFNRIIRESFWDSNISAEEIERIITGIDHRRKSQLFERILLNSSHYLLDLQLFSQADLRLLLEEYQPPEFNNEHAFRRKNIAEVFFFDKELQIGELQWPT